MKYLKRFICLISFLILTSEDEGAKYYWEVYFASFVYLAVFFYPIIKKLENN